MCLSVPLTKMLKPTFDSNNFEELFSNLEFEPSRYERDNCTTLPGQIKIAVLMSATSGPPEQHLRLNAGATPTYVEVRKTIKEYYRATTALSRYTSSMDHQASQHIRKEDRHLWTAELSTKDRKKNAAKAKARSPTQQRQQRQQRQGIWPCHVYNIGKGKIGQGIPSTGAPNKGGYISKGKGKPTGKGKGAPTKGCYLDIAFYLRHLDIHITMVIRYL